MHDVSLADAVKATRWLGARKPRRLPGLRRAVAVSPVRPRAAAACRSPI